MAVDRSIFLHAAVPAVSDAKARIVGCDVPIVELGHKELAKLVRKESRKGNVPALFHVL